LIDTQNNYQLLFANKKEQYKMSTATIQPTSALDVSTEIITAARVVYNSGDEANPQLDAVVVNEEQAADAEKSGTITVKIKGKNETFPVVSVDRQSATTYKANSLKGINELCDNEEEICNMFNRGISVKQANKLRSLLLEKDDDGNYIFQFTEGATDLKPYIAEVTNRRLSPMEKALETIKGMSPEQQAAIAAALAQLQK
jgi:hypothetical protein